MIQQTERYLSPKEIAAELADRIGRPVHPRFVLAMLRAGVPRLGTSARLSSVVAWWEAHPNFVARPTRSGKLVEVR